MDPADQVELAFNLLQQLSIECRREHLGGAGGGLCNLRGKQVFFLDLDADPATQADRCLAALAVIPEADRHHLPPVLREAIDRH